MSEDISARLPPLTKPPLMPSVCSPETHYQQLLGVQTQHFTILILALFLVLGFASAQRADSPHASPPEFIISHIEKGRAAKDSLLVHSEESPLTEEMKKRFGGLEYFPIDLSYQVLADFHLYGRPRRISVPTNLESVIQMERFGRIVGTYAGNPFSLVVFRSLEDGSHLVLFRDATNGSESYSAGRYVRVSDAGEGSYLIDFNNSYSPYCAYNSAYVCPLPPPGNTLTFPVRAGEKDTGANLAH